jgi:cytochrome c-type biogenesis protein CcmE
MKRTHIALIILIVVAIGAILSTVSDSSTYETFRVAEQNPDEEYHVVGKLNKEKPFEYNPQVDANKFVFYLKDNEGTEKKVTYNNTKPQDFEKSEQVVLIGKCVGDEFQANQILMKCPSKYNEQNLKAVTALK